MQTVNVHPSPSTGQVVSGLWALVAPVESGNASTTHHHQAVLRAWDKLRGHVLLLGPMYDSTDGCCGSQIAYCMLKLLKDEVKRNQILHIL